MSTRSWIAILILILAPISPFAMALQASPLSIAIGSVVAGHTKVAQCAVERDEFQFIELKCGALKLTIELLRDQSDFVEFRFFYRKVQDRNADWFCSVLGEATHDSIRWDATILSENCTPVGL